VSDTRTTRRAIRRALLSVSDKTGLVELGRALAEAGAALVSTGSTAAALAEEGLTVTEVGELTGFPEALDGRVKTLHPSVHAGILADQAKQTHRQELARLGIEPFDLVVVNLYPFVDTVMSGANAAEVVEQIDIGGPALARAAAKNCASVAVVVSPQRYADVIAALEAGGTTLEQRRGLAAEAFAHTATYDIAVASWVGNVLTATDAGSGFPAWAGASWHRADVLRYGENPHQRAALYAADFAPEPGLAQAEQLHGKEMSFNNYVDAEAARRAVYDFAEPCVAIVKHANPCGIAVGEDVAQAHQKANDADPISAYGGVIAVNTTLSAEMAAQVADVFTEVVVAPEYEDLALEILTTRKDLRLLRCAAPRSRGGVEWRRISGGLLMQTADALDAPGDDPAAWQLVAGEPADEMTLRDLVFAWRACRAVRSNAILLARGGATVGVGMGQVNRVDAARLAVWRAGEERALGSVAASDAFFPFPDGLEVLTDAGVRAVVQPGGSVRDSEVIAAADAVGVTMYLTGARHFSH
jgi:phosphoribosylaminoimidazolecarboxamide formyltransferase / IMP cyclohydrolase